MSIASLKRLREFPGEEQPTGCAFRILLVTAVVMALGVLALFAWGVTGNTAWVVGFFQAPAALLMVCLALSECWLCLRVRRHFVAGEVLHAAWGWMTASAASHFLGEMCSQILALNGGINPLAHVQGWSDKNANSFRQVGFTLGGTLRYGLLAVGLIAALKAYRAAGFLGRLRVIDWLLLSGAVSYVFWEIAGVAYALRHGKQPGVAEVAGWPVDPLLVILLAEALLLYRSTRYMGRGWISRCWNAYSVGIFLVLLGDLGLWLTQAGYLPWPSSSVIWYIWLPSSCAFALAPAYQLETIYHAITDRFPLTGSQSQVQK